MRMASAPYPKYRWAAALIFVVVVLSSALTIKNDADANVTPSAAQSSSARVLSRPAAAVRDSSIRPPQASQARLLAAYGKLPLSFEANRGQSDRRVKFLARGNGYALFLTPTEAVLSLTHPQPNPLPVGGGAQKASLLSASRSSIGERRPAQGQAAQYALLRLKLDEANRHPRISGIAQLPGMANYFSG